MLVCVFLRGGADGLSLVPPLGDPDYRRLRPSLALPAPDDVSAERSARALYLDGFFGLHPALAPLLPYYRRGEMAIVHAIGSDDDTRSHFEAQDRMERGDANGAHFASGWLTRLLAAKGGARGPLSAAALGKKRPESFRGAPSVAVFESAREHRLVVGPDVGYLAALRGLYAHAGEVETAGLRALDASRRLGTLSPVGPDTEYPDDIFGRRLAEVAALAKADIGLEIATVDLDGWDTHFVQASAVEERAATLGIGIAAFLEDLGDRSRDTTVLVMTEFGRRAYENVSLGTDHGRGGALFAIGHGVRGGRVLGRWPGLGDAARQGPGDLRVTTDYRAVLADYCTLIAGVDASAIFTDLDEDSDIGLFG